MKVDPAVLDQLPLDPIAQRITKRPIDRFPRLVFDRCLEEASETLANYTRASFGNATPCVSETITMPRRSSGPRPVNLLAPATRTLYEALVESLSDSLAPPSRQAGAWSGHKSFGLDGPNEHIIDADIAACYEYIDHRILRDELLLRSMDLARSIAVAEILGELYSNSRGIPQMLSASDRLADTYLSIVDRRLERSGLSIHRYADDYRIASTDWEQANQSLETLAEFARDVGLMLSGHKTQILRRTTVMNRSLQETRFRNAYFSSARADLTNIIYVMTGPYGTNAVEGLIEPAEIEVIQVACRRMLEDWHRGAQSSADDPSKPTSNAFLGRAVLTLANATQGLPSRLLVDLVFHDPLRLEDVCRYIMRRYHVPEAQTEDHWKTVRHLAQMGRQSPWAKVWLLHTIAHLVQNGAPLRGSLLDWVLDQSNERHETVRAEAAWCMALGEALKAEDLQRLYLSATALTQPAISAAASRLSSPGNLVTAITLDSPLNHVAAIWATR